MSVRTSSATKSGVTMAGVVARYVDTLSRVPSSRVKRRTKNCHRNQRTIRLSAVRTRHRHTAPKVLKGKTAEVGIVARLISAQHAAVIRAARSSKASTFVNLLFGGARVASAIEAP